MNKKAQFTAFSIMMAIIILLAYWGLIPTKFHDIPYYDSAGHFVLYGFWGYLSGNAFSKTALDFRTFHIPTGVVLVVCIAIIEEFVQLFSPVRNFSMADLGCGLAGIVLSCLVQNRQRRFDKRND